MQCQQDVLTCLPKGDVATTFGKQEKAVWDPWSPQHWLVQKSHGAYKMCLHPKSVKKNSTPFPPHHRLSQCMTWHIPPEQWNLDEHHTTHPPTAPLTPSSIRKSWKYFFNFFNLPQVKKVCFWLLDTRKVCYLYNTFFTCIILFLAF